MRPSDLDRIAIIADRVTTVVRRPSAGEPLPPLSITSLDDAVAQLFPDVGDPRPAWAERLDLDAIDEALVWLAVAPTISVAIAQGYGVIRADADDKSLSPGLAAELLGTPGPPASVTLLERLGPNGRLIELGVLRCVEPNPAEPKNGLMISLLPTAPLLSAVTGPTPKAQSTRRPDALIFAPALLERSRAAAVAIATGDDAGAALVVVGPPRCGRRLIAEHAAAALEKPLRAIVLNADATALETLSSAILAARLGDEFLHVAVTPGVGDAVLAHVLTRLDRLAAWFSLAFEHERSLTGLGRASVRVTIPFPEAEERRRLFQQFLPKRLHDPALIGQAAHRYRLPGGAIKDVSLALGSSDGPLTLDRIDEMVRSRITHRLSSKARLVRATEGMADLVVGDEVALQLRILVANYRHRRRVLDDWGFGARFGKGLGLSALFSGPPGTGKTMAAAAVARELGVPLYQIELSQIVSKWVGETEKAIDEVFAEAESASAALLFDEADSLFARRTEVSSANDRYANLEVNHLLQKVENFSGVVLLTTNNPNVVDTAFLRRFSYHVSFGLPSPEERATLWRSLIPAAAPIAGPIRFDQLGRDFELSGGHIKNAVIRAAWFAAELDRPIGETLLRLTAHLEVKQLGGVVRDLDVGRALRELLPR